MTRSRRRSTTWSVDAVLVILTPQATTDAVGVADAVLAARRERSKLAPEAGARRLDGRGLGA